MRKVNLETINSTQSWYKVWLLGGYNHIRVKQKYRGRVVLRGDIVKDDSGSYAVFTEQGSSSSQMTAAKVVDVIARRPGCAGQAADAVSAYTGINERRSEIAEQSRVLMSTTTEVWANIQDPLVLLERKSVWSPTRRPLVGETNGKVPLGLGWEKVLNGECLFACICEAHEATRKRIQETQNRDHDDYIAEEGTIIRVIIILCTNLFQCTRQWRLRMRAAVKK